MKNNRKLRIVIQILFTLLGAFLYVSGLKIFLLPKNIIDGGITGISFISNHFTNIPMSTFVLLFNIPFLILGYKNLGKLFTFLTLFSVISISVILSIFNPMKDITNDPLLAAIFGGIILGVGTGLIIRNGGSSDGTEIIAIYLDKRTGFSIGQIIMLFNIFIFLGSGFIFGWDRTMYSLVAYFIASKFIDITIQGLDSTKTVIIISNKYDEIVEQLLKQSDKGITLIDGKGAYSNKYLNVIFAVVSRLEIYKLKSSINSIDKDALIIIQNADVSGKSF